MNRIALLFCLALPFSADAVGPFAQEQPLALRAATANQTVIQRYGTLELALDLKATYDNPFDPEQVDVRAAFASPEGKTFEVSGFLEQPFTRRLEGGSEKIEASGDPVWKVRFTPAVAGNWTYQVFAKDRSGLVDSGKAGFQVSEGSARGFIRRSASNSRAFGWDDGKPYFAVGENVCWGGGRGSYDYDEWLPELAKAGGNFIRIWMCSWNCALEWSEASRGEQRNGNYHGVGVYSLDNAWKLDTILDIADRNGISAMLCLGTYGEFNEGGYFNEGQWKANPYNAANGGPCQKPEEFWTSPAARKLYQQRLRYLAARYGHRTNLHSWEFWNEAKAPAPWVAEMARFLKGTGEFKGKPADPYGHLVSTTYGTDEVWRVPEIDYTQTHSYGTGNIADHGTVVHKEALSHARFGKPHLMAEFGIDWRSPDNKYDPEGQAVNLHNALWASALSGDAGGAMIWWWDSYIHPKKLYPHFQPLARFAARVPWTRGEWKPLSVEVLAMPNASATNTPAVNVYGISNGRLAFAWIQNPANNWKNVYEKQDIAPVRNTQVVLRDLPSGGYTLEWFDTYGGKLIERGQTDTRNGELRLTVPALEKDIAVVADGESD